MRQLNGDGVYREKIYRRAREREKEEKAAMTRDG